MIRKYYTGSSLLVLLTSLILVACGGGGGGSKSDKNQAPVITSSDVFSVKSSRSDGFVAYTATATDADGDDLTWSLTDPQSIFSINANSGVITVASSANLSSSETESYTLTLTVSDESSEVDTLSITVTIIPPFKTATPTVIPSAGQAIIYYYRPDGDYNGWILHAWNDNACNAYAAFADNEGTDWNTGLSQSGEDENFGVYWLFDVKDLATCANFIIHKGSAKDPNDGNQQLDLTGDRWTFAFSSVGFYDAPTEVPTEAPFVIANSAAHWIDRNTLVWRGTGSDVRLVYSEDGELDNNFSSANSISLSATTLTSEQEELVPHLTGSDWHAFSVNASSDQIRTLIKSQLVLASFDNIGDPVSASYVQMPKALDDIFTSAEDDADEAELGIRYTDDGINVSVWAPTAHDIKLKVYDTNKTLLSTHDMTEDLATGVWSYLGDTETLDRKFYRFEVTVYHPASKSVVTTEATDPYSVNTSANGRYSQFVNMSDEDLFPEGWDSRSVPALDAPEDSILLEGHIRDFSVLDNTTPEEHRGKYLAFTDESNATANLSRMAEAGVTHFHMLPAADMASIEENADNRIDLQSTVAELCARVPSSFVCGVEGDNETLLDVLNGFDPASDDAQALIANIRDIDGFNWGYDPHHFNVVEGSYATNPEGVTRIIEFRQMVQAMQSMGLRVVLDVVYNHTSASGLYDNSVFDKLVPGYYHRYSEVSGAMERSSCCENTATEHKMMSKFVVESLAYWTREYGLNGFRFDLMGHLPKSVILAGREAVAAIDPDTYFYGEGWNFGEVSDGRLFVQATQYNMAGTGVGNFNDRPRDTIRDAALSQETVNLVSADHIRLGLAGTLQDFKLKDKNGKRRFGIDFAQSSFADDPADVINYVSKHDNETLWDKLQYSLPTDMLVEDRVRIDSLSAAIPLLSQGVPFFQLGVDKLRSKSMDRDSYNSGDWFNAVDYTNQTNNWNVGLPPVEKNTNQSGIGAISANTNTHVSIENINLAENVFGEFLQIRSGSKLFRLETAADIISRVGFRNVGPDQLPGVIVMTINDGVGVVDLDPELDAIVVVINGTSEAVTRTVTDARDFILHPVQMTSADSSVRTASFSVVNDEGVFSVPAYTAAVFVKEQVGAQGVGVLKDPDYVAPLYGDAILKVVGLAGGNADFEYNDEGQYVATATIETVGNHEFVIGDLADVSLGFADVVDSTDEDNIGILAGSAGKIRIALSTAGTYEFVLDVTGETPSLSVVLKNALISCELPNSNETAPFAITGGGSLYVRGSHSGWNAEPTYKMFYKGNNQYQAVASFSGEFQFKLASDDGSWVTQLWAQQDNGQIESATLEVGQTYNVAYNNAGGDNNRTNLTAGRYSFLLTLNSANPAQGANVGTLKIDQCAE